MTTINRIRIGYVINMIPIILIAVYYYTHILAGTLSFLVPLTLTFFWLVHSFIIKSMGAVLFTQCSKWWIVYAIIALIMVILGRSVTNINFFISRLPYYIIPIMGYFVVRHYNVKELKLLVAFISIVFFANLFYNIGLWNVMPEIFEEQESTEVSIQYGIMMNLADTQFVAVCMFVIGVAFMLFMNTTGFWKRMFYLSVGVVSGFFILFVTLRATVVLLLGVMTLGMIMAFFEPHKINVRPYYFKMSLLLIIVSSFIAVPLLIWILQNTESVRLAERLEDVISFSNGKGDINSLSEGSMAQRFALAQTSLNTFFSSPLNMLIGIGDHTVSFGMDLHKSGIGNHSEFIDILARYGIIGAFVFIGILKSYYKSLKSLSSDRSIIKYVNIIFFVFIIYGFLNLVFSPMLEMFLFTVFPGIIKILSAKRQNNILQR